MVTTAHLVHLCVVTSVQPPLLILTVLKKKKSFSKSQSAVFYCITFNTSTTWKKTFQNLF